MASLLEQLRAAGIPVVCDQPLASLTTLRIGGPARYVLSVATRDQLRAGLELLARENVRAYVIGAGSNILASDRGFDGALVRLRGDFETCRFEGERAVAGAGMMLTAFIDAAARRGLAGLEGLAGIPGTIGGAVAMNAGAHGVWISDRVEEITILSIGDPCAGVRIMDREALNFGYRTSGLDGVVVLEAVFRLTPDEEHRIRERIAAFLRRRAETQPLAAHSAGCVFKNPSAAVSAGRLIDQAGLKGFRIGAVRVSEKHANFIVNEGGSTAAEFMQVVRHVVETVRERHGIALEPEVRLLGDF